MRCTFRRDLPRRDFLKALPAVAATLAACRTPPYRKQDFSRPDRSPVAILPASDYAMDFADLILRGFDLLAVDVRGKRVFLKPNMVEYERDKAINTNPHLVAGAATAFLRAGAREVVVGEGPGHRRDIEYLLTSSGMWDVLSDNRLGFVDLNHDDVTRFPLKSRFTGLDSLWLPTSLLAADFIVSMPKLKTHHLTGLTVSMKNLFGAVPGGVYGWPKNILHFLGIEASIIDLTAVLRPSLTIVDGIVGMEGDGPIMGRPRRVGFVAMGADLPAVDATCARIIGLDPNKVSYLAVAGEFLGNIGEARIEQRGERPGRYAAQFDVTEPIQKMRL
jgi:uncharacterized protein (DUF362 family)